MPSGRHRSRGRASGRRMSSVRRFKGRRPNRRTRRSKRPVTRRRSRFPTSSSKSRRGGMSRRSFMGSRRTGRKRVLSMKPDAPRYSSFTYKPPARRPSRVNTKFQRKVAMAAHNQYRFTDIAQSYASCGIGACNWLQVRCGGDVDLFRMHQSILNNWDGFHVGPLGTSTDNNKEKLNIHIDSCRTDAVFVNSSNTKAHIELYEVIPRHTINRGSPSYEDYPVAMLQAVNYTGDLWDNNSNISGDTPGLMANTDVRFTPFMSPRFCRAWKIINVRKFKVHAGAQFDVKLAVNNVNVKFVDPDVNIVTKKGQGKWVMVKFYGELGLAANADSSLREIRNTQIALYGRYNIMMTGRPSVDDRKVIQDLHTEYNSTTGLVSSSHINQTTDQFVTDVAILPTTTA